MTLSESSRPTALGGVTGQDKAVAVLRGLIERGALAGRAYWLAGPSGSGKTTIARIIAAEVADPLGTDEMDAGAVTTQFLDDWQRRVANRPLFGRGWALIVNEAHGLRKDVIRRLLCVLEALPRHVVVIFTTTMEGQATLFEDKIDASPLLSRCVDLPMTRRGSDLELSFAIRVRNIARASGMDGQPLDRYVALAKREKCNMRAMFNRIEAGEMLTAGGVQ